MIAAIVVSSIIAYALLGTIGGAVGRSILAEHDTDEPIVAVLGFVFWPLMLVAMLLLGPFMLIRAAQNALTPVFRKSSVISAIRTWVA